MTTDSKLPGSVQMQWFVRSPTHSSLSFPPPFHALLSVGGLLLYDRSMSFNGREQQQPRRAGAELPNATDNQGGSIYDVHTKEGGGQKVIL